MLDQLLPELILSAAAIVLPLVWHAADLLVQKQLAKLPAVSHSLVADIVSTGVHFVEQAFPELQGADKKVQAMEVIQKMLASHKLSASPDEISVLIEEAVFLMNGGSKPSVPASSPVGFSK